jgi:DNA-binding response OmpR family regulator
VRILIVEDEVLIAWMLADCLEGAGHEVLERPRGGLGAGVATSTGGTGAGRTC